MKILFLCGSLEPGRDGVGDYTRKLALQLMDQGHQAQAVSLNDCYVKENMEQLQESDGKSLPVLRIPSSLSPKLRFKVLQVRLDMFRPDWVSLQYVPYAFDKRGIPIFLGGYLSKLKISAKWHIMIHEPFIAKQQLLKNKLIRRSQMISLQLIRRYLSPAIFHTSIPQYQKLLHEISIKSKLLGLFGNITIQRPGDPSKEKNITDKKKFTGLYFGTAPAPQYHTIFAQKIKSFCENHEYSLKVIICGKSGKNGKQFVEEIGAACKGLSLEISFLGELDPVTLSNLFLEADFGIARISPRFLGKSGSAISMLEHGLPLWVPLLLEDSIRENLDFRPDLCFHDLPDVIRAAERKECISRLPEIAEKFMQDLNS